MDPQRKRWNVPIMIVHQQDHNYKQCSHGLECSPKIAQFLACKEADTMHLACNVSSKGPLRVQLKYLSCVSGFAISAAFLIEH